MREPHTLPNDAANKADQFLNAHLENQSYTLWEN